VEVDALVDTGATRLCLKPSVIRALGLKRTETTRSATAVGPVRVKKYEPVQLELMGRKEVFDVIGVPEDVPNLLGQVPLEVLDLVVDSRHRKLVGNPEHGGIQTIEIY
jgi:clan AA aspartic protease